MKLFDIEIQENGKNIVLSVSARTINEAIVQARRRTSGSITTVTEILDSTLNEELKPGEQFLIG